MSRDPANEETVITSTRVHTGQAGRPRVHIDRDLLETALRYRGPTDLADIFDCAPRTIRRLALQYGLVDAGAPVYVDYAQPDGTVRRIYTSAANRTHLEEPELDQLILYILDAFPTIGRRMIDGHLKLLGHRIPRAQILASYARVYGAPQGSFGPYKIQRRVYKVAGPNSLWHHDGQHGTQSLVCFKSTEPYSQFCRSYQVENCNPCIH